MHGGQEEVLSTHLIGGLLDSLKTALKSLEALAFCPILCLSSVQAVLF